jgi:hypothetical protein
VNLKEICKANREAKNAQCIKIHKKSAILGISLTVFTSPRLKSTFFQKNIFSDAKEVCEANLNIFFQKNVYFCP